LLDTVADPTLEWSPDETLAASEITCFQAFSRMQRDEYPGPGSTTSWIIISFLGLFGWRLGARIV
jgi:hypothetical protein